MTDPIPTTSALATSSGELNVFSGIAAFDNAQRMAKALSSSTLVPPAYQGQQGLANSLIALEIAGRMRLSPLVVMQNLAIIHGRPSWSSSFLIATVNASGRFSPLRFVFDNPAAPTSCYAVATDRASGEELIGEAITIEMAKKEGWHGRSGSKWQTMPGQMLRYRAASFWTRVFCPEVSLGLATQEEVVDIEPVAVSVEPPAQEVAVLEDPAEPGLGTKAVERMAQLITVREVEAALLWADNALAETLITADDRAAIGDAAASRVKTLSAALTVAARQKALSALATRDGFEAEFREAFNVAADIAIATAITQHQHQEWINAQS